MPPAEKSSLELQKPSVHTFIVTTLRDGIVNGEFQPGQRLIEADLHGELGVSRPALREALRQLEAERLVRITPFKGPSVCDIDWPEAEEIYEVRELLEGHATHRFASAATSSQIAQLQAALTRFEQVLTEPMPQKQLVDSARVFFDLILEGSCSQVIADVLRGLSARISMLRFQSMSLGGRARQSAHEMRAIAEAVALHDPEAAQAAARAHVRSARAAAREVFERRELRRQSPRRRSA